MQISSLSPVPSFPPAGAQQPGAGGHVILGDVIQATVVGSPAPEQLYSLEFRLRALDGTEDGAAALRQLRHLMERERRCPVLDFTRARGGLPPLQAPQDSSTEFQAAVEAVAVLQDKRSDTAARTRHAREAIAAIAGWMGGDDEAAGMVWRTIEGEAFGDPPTEGPRAFARFLARLADTPVHGQAAQHARVAQWLRAVTQPDRAAFRQTVYQVCIEGTRSCQDTILRTWNRLIMLTLKDDAEAGRYAGRLDDLYNVALCTFRMRELRKQAHAKALALHSANEQRARKSMPTLLVDPVEIHLGYEVALRQDLALPLAVDAMLYPQFSHLAPGDIEAALTRIREAEARDFPAYLVLDCPPFMDEIRRRADPQAFQAACDEAGRDAAGRGHRARQYAAWLPVVNRVLSEAGLPPLPMAS